MGALLSREIRVALRAGSGALMGVLFFLAVVTVFPFAIGPDLNQLGRIGPAILWIGALLASLLGLDRLFATEREDGSLDALVIDLFEDTVERLRVAMNVGDDRELHQRLRRSSNQPGISLIVSPSGRPSPNGTS